MHRILGEIRHLPAIDRPFVELLGRASGTEQKLFRKGVELASFVQRAKRFYDRLSVLVRVGLEMRTPWEVIANIQETLRAHAANAVHRFVAAVAGGKDRLPRFISVRQ